MELAEKINLVELMDNTVIEKTAAGYTIDTADGTETVKDIKALNDWLDYQIKETLKAVSVEEAFDIMPGAFAMIDSISGEWLIVRNAEEENYIMHQAKIEDVDLSTPLPKLYISL